MNEIIKDVLMSFPEFNEAYSKLKARVIKEACWVCDELFYLPDGVDVVNAEGRPIIVPMNDTYVLFAVRENGCYGFNFGEADELRDCLLELSPGDPQNCKSNGRHGIECQCENCDFFLDCFKSE